MAVVALGKAGSREMMAGSDLDLMLVYDLPTDVTESRGARHLPASQWFVRASHAYVAAVTAPGVDGPKTEALTGRWNPPPGRCRPGAKRTPGADSKGLRISVRLRLPFF